MKPANRDREGCDPLEPDGRDREEPAGWDWLRQAFPHLELRFPDERFAHLRHPLTLAADAETDWSRLDPEALLLDLETLGFHGRPLFLVGLFRIDRERGGGEILQYLARDYTEEEAVIRAFGQIARGHRLWISFNGKAFDVPFLRTRAAFYSIPLPEPAEHLDLLHAARRVYRGVLPDCRLKTLEVRVFGRFRLRDLDGGEIPGAYHDFVRTGRTDEMERILRHNRDDLLTLGRLHLHLAGP